MKKIMLGFFTCLSFSISYSQSFMHGAGIGIFVTDNPRTDAAISGTFTYSPRFNFVEGNAMSVSVGIPLNIGFSGGYSLNYDSYYGTQESNTLGVLINAPVMVNLNIGAGSSKENESRMGFFVGAGFGLHYGKGSGYALDQYGNEYYDSHYSTAFGPAANAGLRIAVGHNERNIELRFSYMKAGHDVKTAVYGFNTLFNF